LAIVVIHGEMNYKQSWSTFLSLSCVRASFVCCCDAAINIVVDRGFHPGALLFHDVVIHECCGTLLFLSAAEMLLFFSMCATESKAGQAMTQQW
jgi:hypothetical protein